VEWWTTVAPLNHIPVHAMLL